MTRRSFVLPAALLLLPICAPPADALDRARGTDPAAIYAHIAHLASPELEGRMTGERGNVLAARYIADVFRRAGLRPVGTWREMDPRATLDGTGFYQPFAVPWGVRRGRSVTLNATVGGARIRYHVGRDFDVSSASHGGSASGEVVFAGYGLDTLDPDRDDYRGQDLRGKIALVLAGVPDNSDAARLRLYGSIRRKAMAARDRGASALVLALSERDKPEVQSNERAIDCGIPVIAVGRQVAEGWLHASGRSIAQLEQDLRTEPRPFATGVTASLTADVLPAPRVTANIVGLLPGSDPALRREVVVVGGHMDHIGRGVFASMANQPGAIHPGADDNASGASGVLALAEHFGAQPTRPRRSLLFICFTGEELGLLGSQHYVAKPIIPLDRTVAMLNMDMIGRMVRDRLAVVGVGTSPAWRPMLDELGARDHFILSYTDAVGGGSDQESFGQKGIPVLFFFTGTHADYHRPSDTADKIAVLDEARVTEMVAEIARRVANAPTRPQPAVAPTGSRP